MKIKISRVGIGHYYMDISSYDDVLKASDVVMLFEDRQTIMAYLSTDNEKVCKAFIVSKLTQLSNEFNAGDVMVICSSTIKLIEKED